jgi:hypothetical protein
MIALESHSSAVYDVFLFQVATEVVPVQTELPVTTNTVKDRDSDELPLDLPAQPVSTPFLMNLVGAIGQAMWYRCMAVAVLC